MFYSEVELAARKLLNDVGGPTQRYSKSDFADWMTQAVRHHALIRPDLFSAERELVATAAADGGFRAGRYYHGGPPGSLRLMDVLGYRSASATTWTPVNEVEYAQLVDQGVVARTPGGAGRTIHRGLLYGGSVDDTERSRPEWARHPKSPNKFFFSPAPAVGAVLHVEYSRIPQATPPDYGQTVEIPDLTDGYLSTMVHCVVWLAESVNDRSVVSGRAQMYLDSFMQGLGTEMEARQITDEPNEAVPQEATDANR